MTNFGVTLTGGGARGSYQAGVLKGIFELLSENGIQQDNNIFKYWSGVSAGSINSSYISAGIDDLATTTAGLVKIWSELEPENVYRTDFRSLTANSLKWVGDLTLGSVTQRKLAHSLLDTEPLWEYLKSKINLTNIQKNLDQKKLGGIACSAYSYTRNRTITFLQSNEDISWNRERRSSEKAKINIDHIMASCAIPLLFPSVKIDKDYFADGGFRNLSPISPMVHMNVRKILVIGVRGRDEFSEKNYHTMPTIAKISGAMLNALFFDTIDIDLERLKHINDFLEATKSTIETKSSSYSKISYTVIRPSRDISKMAAEHTTRFPRLIKFLLGGLGPLSESAELASYILFVPKFTQKLIELGYEDARKQKDEIFRWIDTEID